VLVAKDGLEVREVVLAELLLVLDALGEPGEDDVVATNLHRRASPGETRSRGGRVEGRAGFSVCVCVPKPQ